MTLKLRNYTTHQLTVLASSLWLRARHFLRYELEHFFWSFLREWKQINFPKFVWNSCNIWWKPLASFMAILVFLTQFMYTEDQTIIGLFSQPITIWDFKTKRATSMEECERLQGAGENQLLITWDALLDLVPFAHFKKREEHSWGTITFSRGKKNTRGKKIHSLFW